MPGPRCGNGTWTRHRTNGKVSLMYVRRDWDSHYMFPMWSVTDQAMSSGDEISMPLTTRPNTPIVCAKRESDTFQHITSPIRRGEHFYTKCCTCGHISADPEEERCACESCKPRKGA